MQINYTCFLKINKSNLEVKRLLSATMEENNKCCNLDHDPVLKELAAPL